MDRIRLLGEAMNRAKYSYLPEQIWKLNTALIARNKESDDINKQMFQFAADLVTSKQSHKNDIEDTQEFFDALARDLFDSEEEKTEEEKRKDALKEAKEAVKAKRYSAADLYKAAATTPTKAKVDSYGVNRFISLVALRVTSVGGVTMDELHKHCAAVLYALLKMGEAPWDDDSEKSMETWEHFCADLTAMMYLTAVAEYVGEKKRS